MLPTNPLVRFSTPDPAALVTGSALTIVSTGGYMGHAFPIHRYERTKGAWQFIGWAMRGASWWRPRTWRDDLPETQRLTHVGPSAWPGHASAWTEDDFWAPELHRIHGRLLLFYTVPPPHPAHDRRVPYRGATSYPWWRQARRRDGTLCIGVAASSSNQVAGPYTDALGEPLLCRPDGAIDAHVFVHGRGEGAAPHLLWKDDANAHGRRTTIFLQRLRPDGLGLLGEPRPLLSNEPDSRAASGTRGPAPLTGSREPPASAVQAARGG